MEDNLSKIGKKEDFAYKKTNKDKSAQFNEEPSF